MTMGLFQAIWTVVALVIFVAIVIWSWSDKRKDDFEKASRMALDEGELSQHSQVKKESKTIRGHHG
jgi:cytochrome c oxidase cbb3-type subunit 4